MNTPSHEPGPEPVPERVAVAETIAPATAAAASDVLRDSHADYPAFVHVFPDPARRRRALGHFFRATVDDAIRAGVVTAHRDPTDDRYLATAVWLPPGGFPWTPRRKLYGTPRLARVLLTDPRRARAFLAIGTNAERHHPAGDHWYLVALGVRRSAQRRGLGSRLLELGLRRADQHGVACYLETSDPANVAFYEHHGFHVADPALQLTDGGPTHIAMRRPAPGHQR